MGKVVKCFIVIFITIFDLSAKVTCLPENSIKKSDTGGTSRLGDIINTDSKMLNEIARNGVRGNTQNVLNNTVGQASYVIGDHLKGEGSSAHTVTDNILNSNTQNVGTIPHIGDGSQSLVNKTFGHFDSMFGDIIVNSGLAQTITNKTTDLLNNIIEGKGPVGGEYLQPSKNITLGHLNGNVTNNDPSQAITDAFNSIIGDNVPLIRNISQLIDNITGNSNGTFNSSANTSIIGGNWPPRGISSQSLDNILGHLQGNFNISGNSTNNLEGNWSLYEFFLQYIKNILGHLNDTVNNIANTSNIVGNWSLDDIFSQYPNGMAEMLNEVNNSIIGGNWSQNGNSLEPLVNILRRINGKIEDSGMAQIVNAFINYIIENYCPHDGNSSQPHDNMAGNSSSLPWYVPFLCNKSISELPGSESGLPGSHAGSYPGSGVGVQTGFSGIGGRTDKENPLVRDLINSLLKGIEMSSVLSNVGTNSGSDLFSNLLDTIPTNMSFMRLPIQLVRCVFNLILKTSGMLFNCFKSIFLY